MALVDISHGQSVVTLNVNGQVLSLTPSDLWQVVDVVKAYVCDNSLEFSEVPSIVIQIGELQFRVAATANFRFWSDVGQGRWEPNTFQILEKFLRSDTHYVDVGAWIGPTLLFAAQLAASSIAFEPDPIAFRELTANVGLNCDEDWFASVDIRNQAVSSQVGVMKLGSRGGGGDSMSSAFYSSEDTSWEVGTTTLEMLIEEQGLTGKQLFVKMDIEGGEYDLVPKLRRFFSESDVDLYLSVHPNLWLDRLSSNGGDSFLTRIRRRFRFAWAHANLAWHLPFRRLLHSDGRDIRFAELYVKPLLLGVFPWEIMATNRSDV